MRLAFEGPGVTQHQKETVRNTRRYLKTQRDISFAVYILTYRTTCTEVQSWTDITLVSQHCCLRSLKGSSTPNGHTARIYLPLRTIPPDVSGRLNGGPRRFSSSSSCCSLWRLADAGTTKGYMQSTLVSRCQIYLGRARGATVLSDMLVSIVSTAFASNDLLGLDFQGYSVWSPLTV